MELQSLKKVGPKTIEYLNKLNIYCVEDLLDYYPYRYNIYKPVNLKDCDTLDTITINATIESTPKLAYIRRNLNRITFKALSNNLLINVSIFNRSFLNQHLDVGKNITLIGKYDEKKNNFVASDLKFGWINTIKIEPIYHIIKGLKNANMNMYILNALEQINNVNDFIPDYINNEYRFIDKLEALKIFHNPENANDLKQARIKLIYEELFLFMLKINFLKIKNQKIDGLERKFDQDKVKNFIKSLPFSLTVDQMSAVNDCLNDLKSKKRMNRLIEGDVGSGKTIVATILMYANTISGYQSALMAPTEILATQHYESIKKIMEPFSVNVALLVGSMKKSEHKKIVDRI